MVDAHGAEVGHGRSLDDLAGPDGHAGGEGGTSLGVSVLQVIRMRGLFRFFHFPVLFLLDVFQNAYFHVTF